MTTSRITLATLYTVYQMQRFHVNKAGLEAHFLLPDFTNPPE